MSSLSFLHALKNQKIVENKRKMKKLLSDVTLKIGQNQSSFLSNIPFYLALLSAVISPFLLVGIN